MSNLDVAWKRMESHQISVQTGTKTGTKDPNHPL